MAVRFTQFLIFGILFFAFLAQGQGNHPVNNKNCDSSLMEVSSHSDDSRSDKPTSPFKFSPQVEDEMFPPNFTIQGVKIIDTGVLDDSDDRTAQEYNLKYLLEMTANNLSYKNSARDYLAADKFYLAQPLGDGTSLEFTYSGDKRTKQHIYRLSAINLIKKNGERQLLDSSPLIDEGTRLRQPFEIWNSESENTGFGDSVMLSTRNVPDQVIQEIRKRGVQDPSEIANQISQGFASAENRQVLQMEVEKFDAVKIPTAISGKTLKHYLLWLNRLIEIKADVLEKMNNPTMGRLLFRYRATNLVELFIRGSRSVLSKALVYAFVLVAAGSTIKSEMPKWINEIPALSTLMEAKREVTTDQFEVTLSEFSMRESKAGGHISMYVYQDKENNNYMIEKFEKAETLLISSLDGDGKAFQLIQKKQDPLGYDKYLKIIKGLPIDKQDVN